MAKEHDKYYATVRDKRGLIRYASAGYADRNDAVLDAFNAKPQAKSVSVCRSEGFNIQWFDRFYFFRALAIGMFGER